MTELLFFKWDHSTQTIPTPPKDKLAGLPQRFDLITAQPDGWNWSTLELTNPWYRIIAWPALAWPLPAQAAQLLDSIPATFSGKTRLSYLQYRAWLLDLSNTAVIPQALRTWWQDDTRVQPKFLTNMSPGVVLAAAKTARAIVSFP